MKEKTHWLQSPNKNYLGHWDLPESGELVVTIDSAQWEPVTNPITQKTESLRVVRFKDKKIKPLICNQTNAQSIITSGGVKYMEDSKGVVICLFLGRVTDNRTKEEIDCVRIKRDNPYTKKALEDLFDSKKSKLDQPTKDRIDNIVLTEEASSYQKVIKHLESL